MNQYFSKKNIFVFVVGLLASLIGVSGYELVIDEPDVEYVSFDQALGLAAESGFNYYWEVSGETILTNEMKIHCKEDDECNIRGFSVSYYEVKDTITTGSKFDKPEDFLHRVQLPKKMNKYFLIGEWIDYRFRFLKREEVSF